MKIVCCDPPYSNYFNDIAEYIESKLGAEVEKECIAFNRAAMHYLPGFVYVKLESNDCFDCTDKSFIRNIRNLVNLDGSITSSNLLNDLYHYYMLLDRYISNNKNAIYFFYNDLRWDHSFAIELCKKYNCKYFVFERGVFRPHTTTMDTQGVNANSLFRSLKMSANAIDDKIFFKKRKERSSKFSFFCYFFKKRLNLLFMNKSLKRIYSNSQGKGFRDYSLLLMKSNKKKVLSDIKSPYIFVPLQLSNDTQTLINSSFSSTQDFINKVTNDYLSSTICLDKKLVFKIHPMDVDSYDFHPDVLVSTNDTGVLVSNSELCVTINSTVGFEAMFSKKVICLGDSFYTEHGYVKSAKENIFTDIDATVASKEYRNFVLENYQLPGSIYNYTSCDLDYISQKIIKIVKNEIN